jgi:protein-S-isoprenylcysteine O-methyltransferase Ste14
LNKNFIKPEVHPEIVMRQILMLVRHLVAILMLPFMVAVFIPRWLVSGFGLVTLWTSTPARVLGHVAGGVFFLVGFSLFLWCLYLFAARGKGTLAPWDPPKHLVVTGPYRYVRNPMISGVLMIILGEALVHGSATLSGWCLVFFLMNQIYFMIMEEPMLEGRFGEDYRHYKSQVPRWIPRVKPWLQP